MRSTPAAADPSAAGRRAALPADTGRVADEIVGGAGGRPRRGSAVAVGLVAVALFGYAVSHRHGVGRPPDEPPAIDVAARDGPRLGSGPRLSGRVGLGPPGLRLLVDRAEPRVVDVHTLAVTPVPGLQLPPGQPARVVQLGRGRLAAVAPLYGRHGGTYLVRPGRPPKLLRGVGMVVPGRDGTLVVAVSRLGASTVTGFDAAHRVRWQWSRRGTVDPLRDTPAGLVVASYRTATVAYPQLQVVDRRTGTVRRRLGEARRALAVDDRSVAWLPARCGLDCPLVRTELAVGTTRGYRLPERRVPAAAAFAPDGRHLALSFPGVPVSTRPWAKPGFVAVLDVRTGALTRVAGLSTPASQHVDVTWSADGRWLVLGVSWPEQELIALWRPNSRLVIVPLALPGGPATARLTALY